MSIDKKNIIIYNTVDGKAAVSLYARDGMVWMNQNQMAELFDTLEPNISMHISTILKEAELHKDSVVKDYLTTAVTSKTAAEIIISRADASKENMAITSQFWKANVDRIIAFNDKKVLTGKGFISNAVMEQKVREIYAEFDARRKAYEADLADKQDVKEIEDAIKKHKK